MTRSSCKFACAPFGISRAIFMWLLLLLPLAPLSSSAQILQRLDPPAVDLAADQVQIWSSDVDRHWVILSGRVSITQDGEGLRADEAVVLVEPGRDGNRLMQRIEVKAAGSVRLTSRPSDKRDKAELLFRSKLPVRLKPYDPSGMKKVGPAEIDHARLSAAFGSEFTNAVAQAQKPIQAETSEAPAANEHAVAEARPQALDQTQPIAEARPQAVDQTLPIAEAALAMPATDHAAPEPVVAEANLPEKQAESSPESPATAAQAPAAAPADPMIRPATQPPIANTETDDSPLLSNPLDNPNLNSLPSRIDVPRTSPGPASPPPATFAPPISAPAITPPVTPAAPGITPIPADDGQGLTIPPALVEEGPVMTQPPALILGDAPLPLDDQGITPEITPGTERIVGLYRRDGNPNYKIVGDGIEGDTRVIIIQGGVNVVVETGSQFGTADLSADRVVIWLHANDKTKVYTTDSGGKFQQSNRAPMEIYLEGNVIYRMDERKVAGNGDERLVKAERAYYDARTDRFNALQAELNIFAPGLLAPIRTKADRISQWRSVANREDGSMVLGLPMIDVMNTTTTGSRFPNPGYRFHSRLMRITQEEVPLKNPITGSSEPAPVSDFEWKLDARENRFYVGNMPIFYMPRFVATPDDLDLPLRQIQFRTNNYFGQQILSDWNMFKLLGMKRPKQVDNWNLDIDYLSARGPAVGSEIGYFGKESLGGLLPGSYAGFGNFWTIWDNGTDVLGTGPAVITDGPAGSGDRGFQRSKVPVYNHFRGRYEFRHMQSLLSEFAPEDEDLKFQVEFGYLSDRYFLEQYYKRLYDSGPDQDTAVYLIRQKQNTALTLLAQGNLQSFYTDTQWLPKLDYYRIGDSLLGDTFTHYSHSGADYANVHTDVMVNNPTLFAFQPYDPISQTSGSFGSGRIWTSHELDMPLNLGPFKLTPYVQGQAIGWSSQYNSALPAYDLPPDQVQQLIRNGNTSTMGRLWGAAGARFNFMLWRIYTDAESEILNVHGLNHKMNFGVDYRDAYSATPLQRIGVQDSLDDNTYEFVRRYFAFTSYGGGVLPPQYNPLLLATRRNLSPIAGTTDVLQSMQTVQLSWNNRFQTKRGPEGSRRVIDWMLFDVSTTYFPQANRDNFGQTFGLNKYNWEWYVGDRTTVFSNGWFEFWDVGGDPLNKTNVQHTNDPFGMKVITSGFSFNRPPKGNATLSYTILQTGMVNTSALNFSYSYWVSPKWYSTFSTSYDFGNGISLGTNVSVTRVGADYLTSLGLNVDPQRQSTMVAVEITPRLSPNTRLGQSSGPRFDSRFAPTQ
ncbi:MAG: hypothetical protein ACKO5E_22680 [bacterium]